MKQVGFLLVLSALGALGSGFFYGFPSAQPSVEEGYCAAPVEAQPSVQWVSLAEAFRLHSTNEAGFIDARPHEVYASGHVLGAWHADVSKQEELTRSTHELEKSKTWIAYCDTDKDCGLSTTLAKKLVQAGFLDVRILEGGFPVWDEQGYPAEAGECKACQ